MQKTTIPSVSYFSSTSIVSNGGKDHTGDRVVVLGSGWGGFNLCLNTSTHVPLTVISPNNHFVFTPLLPSTAVGTLEFRCIQEPVRSVLDPKNGKFVHAKARKLDPINKTIQCESVHNDIFDVEYDKLVIAVGVKTNVSIFFFYTIFFSLSNFFLNYYISYAFLSVHFFFEIPDIWYTLNC